MKRGITLSLMLFILVMTISAFDSLSSEKETRDLDGFTKINFGVSGDLYVNIGNEFKVVLEGSQSLLDNIETDISSGKLTIKKDNWRLNMNEKVTIYVTLPEIEGLSVSGSGRAEIMDVVKGDNLSLSVSGSGKLYTSGVEINSMNSSISGSGDIIVGGDGDISSADLAISGSGSYKGEDARAASMSVRISGSGSCLCNVSESLKASVSGSGNVTYVGNPKVDARISGSGRVRSR